MAEIRSAWGGGHVVEGGVNVGRFVFVGTEGRVTGVSESMGGKEEASPSPARRGGGRGRGKECLGRMGGWWRVGWGWGGVRLFACSERDCILGGSLLLGRHADLEFFVDL